MTNQRVEHLAYWLWQQRGMPLGSPDEDWFLAEKLVGVQRDPTLADMPLFAFGLERRTR